MTDKYDFIDKVAKISSFEIFGIDACISWEELFEKHLSYDARRVDTCCPEETALSTSEDIETLVKKFNGK
jgi:hypothetical protein